MTAIEVQALRKTYGNSKTPALDGVSLTVDQGDFFGLLGLNGAGKTTLIHTLVGLVKPSGGSVKIHGHDVTKDPYMAKKLTGIVPQEMNINFFNTVKEVSPKFSLFDIFFNILVCCTNKTEINRHVSYAAHTLNGSIFKGS